MSAPSSPEPIPGLELQPATAVRPLKRRHPLGLPAGSVRALLTALIFALLAVVLILGERDKVPMLYNYLWYLLLLIIAHYFAAHGSSIGAPHVGEAHPWGLPRGFFRVLLVGGFIGLVIWLYYSEHRLFEVPLEVSKANPLVLLAGFFLGVLVARLVRWVSGDQGPPAWFQDIQAWVSLIAVLMLAVQFVVVVLINPRLSNPLVMGDWWDHTFAAIVGFYFGARS